MNDIEKAYLAGLVDGDGYIGIMKSDKQGRINYYLVFQIQLTNEKLLKYAAGLIGDKVTGPYKYGDRKDIFSLSIIGKKAAKVIEQIAPYLMGKVVQAELAELFPIGATAGGGPMDAETKSVQAHIYEDMKALNNKS